MAGRHGPLMEIIAAGPVPCEVVQALAKRLMGPAPRRTAAQSNKPGGTAFYSMTVRRLVGRSLIPIKWKLDPSQSALPGNGF